MSQSKYEAITCGQRKARENVKWEDTTGFRRFPSYGGGWFASHWLRKRREFYQPISEWSEETNQTKREFLSSYNWKPLYCRVFVSPLPFWITGKLASSLHDDFLVRFRDGEEWYRLRHSIAPKIMRPKIVEENFDNFSAVTEDAIARLAKLKEECGPGGYIPDLEDELSKWSTEGLFFKHTVNFRSW